MPLFYEKVIGAESRICIWEITEPVDELLEISGITKENVEKAGKKTPKRQLEWITIRLLLKKLMGMDQKIELNYDEYGKPHLKGINKHISISHTRQFVAAMVHGKKNVGIDIEIITSRIEKIKHRFLNAKENEWIKGAHEMEKAYIIWGAKESAYKIYAEGGLAFKEMLEVDRFCYEKCGTTIVALKKNNVTCAYPIWWENLNGLMLVYAMES